MPMQSSFSERRVLHVVVTPPWAGDALQRALAHRRAGDVLLLAQEAAGAACAAVALAPALADGLCAASARVLDADLAACGRSGSALRDGIAAIDDAAWVALAADCASCVTWA
ncbi:MAG: DsrH/TusB family sulfur metabolism protein [Pseudomonadota bacterium]|jgi:sulfur relay protein TusB/DsrH